MHFVCRAVLITFVNILKKKIIVCFGDIWSFPFKKNIMFSVFSWNAFIFQQILNDFNQIQQEVHFKWKTIQMNFVIKKVLFDAKCGSRFNRIFLILLNFITKLPWKALFWVIFSTKSHFLIVNKPKEKKHFSFFLLDYIIVSLNRFELCAIWY